MVISPQALRDALGMPYWNCKEVSVNVSRKGNKLIIRGIDPQTKAIITTEFHGPKTFIVSEEQPK